MRIKYVQPEVCPQSYKSILGQRPIWDWRHDKLLWVDIYENKIIIRIRDNGEGIEEEHLPRLFERFYRVDKSGNRRTGGSGLGLAIVKHIIEAHAEQIFVESQAEIGSEFSFTLDKGEDAVTA